MFTYQSANSGKLTSPSPFLSSSLAASATSAWLSSNPSLLQSASSSEGCSTMSSLASKRAKAAASSAASALDSPSAAGSKPFSSAFWSVRTAERFLSVETDDEEEGAGVA